MLPSNPSAPLSASQVITLDIQSLNSSGDGIGRIDPESPVIFVPNTVPGDRIQAKITMLKRNYGYGTLIEILQPSPDRVRPPCIVADKCGGCQWMPVHYDLQLKSKQDQVLQALSRVGQFKDPVILDILAAPTDLGYRNKVTYPLQGNQQSGQVKAGYYQRGTHKLINLNQCPIQDEAFNPLLKAIKQDIQLQNWSIYDEKKHQGDLRHLGFRIGRRTGEILITLVSTSADLPHLREQAAAWLKQYPNVVGVHLNVNADHGNRIFGSETFTLAGADSLTEIFAGLNFKIQANTFFQVYTEQAETLIFKMMAALDLQGNETVIDAYCGIGTLSLPMAQNVKAVLGMDNHVTSIDQATVNALANDIANASFQAGKVEDLLANVERRPDILLLDPPRKGCATVVMDQIQRLQPAKVMYLSCNPSTLARDLQSLCAEGNYELIWVQPADFFPQTSHVESLAYLQRAEK